MHRVCMLLEVQDRGLTPRTGRTNSRPLARAARASPPVPNPFPCTSEYQRSSQIVLHDGMRLEVRDEQQLPANPKVGVLIAMRFWIALLFSFSDLQPVIMSSCFIEEIDEASDPTRFDTELGTIWKAHQHNGKEFLATVFDFLDRKSKFFHSPDVSKTLARLLRDVKQKGKPPQKAAAVNGAPTTSNPGPSDPLQATMHFHLAALAYSMKIDARDTLL